MRAPSVAGAPVKVTVLQGATQPAVSVPALAVTEPVPMVLVAPIKGEGPLTATRLLPSESPGRAARTVAAARESSTRNVGAAPPKVPAPMTPMPTAPAQAPI